MKHKLELLQVLVTRDIRVRYAQSVIGALWCIIQPLALMFVFTLVFGKLLKTDTEGIPYPIFVYSCLVPWSFFSAALTRGTASIVLEGNVIKKVAVARWLFPVSGVLSSFVDFAASALVFVIMIFWYHISLTPWMLMVIPLILLQILLTIGLSLFLSAINAYFRDIHFAMPLAIQVLFYGSPIVYAITVVPQNLKWAYDLNPMAGLMVGYRNVLVKGVAPDWQLLGIAAIVTAVAMILGYLVFNRLQGNFADVV